ncbi:hypothetical protein SVAN01_00267 [Stagonosporopsis vannaccii]|nr:hypothetical protein SVAN01_00267 [Stagonosporopsis vannaccii]
MPQWPCQPCALSVVRQSPALLLKISGVACGSKGGRSHSPFAQRRASSVQRPASTAGAVKLTLTHAFCIPASLRSRSQYTDCGGALRTMLHCARILPVALPDLCNNHKRSERPSPHSRLSVTRGLRTSVFDTPTTLAFSKLQPRPRESWFGYLKPRPDDARPCCWNSVLHSTGRGRSSAQFALITGPRRPRCEPLPLAHGAAVPSLLRYLHNKMMTCIPQSEAERPHCDPRRERYMYNDAECHSHAALMAHLTCTSDKLLP